MTDTLPYGKISSSSHLGALVRYRRRSAGVTQADAAALAGVGVRFLSDLERGKETAEIGKVLQVLERLGLEISVSPRAWDGSASRGEAGALEEG